MRQKGFSDLTPKKLKIQFSFANCVWISFHFEQWASQKEKASAPAHIIQRTIFQLFFFVNADSGKFSIFLVVS